MPNLFRTFVEPTLSKEAHAAYVRRQAAFTVTLLAMFVVWTSFVKGTRFSGYYVGAMLLYMAVYMIATVLKQQSLHQLRRSELAKGRKEAEQILKEVGLQANGKK